MKIELIDSCGPFGSDVYTSILVSYFLLFGVVAFIIGLSSATFITIFH